MFALHITCACGYVHKYGDDHHRTLYREMDLILYLPRWVLRYLQDVVPCPLVPLKSGGVDELNLQIVNNLWVNFAGVADKL